MSKPKRPWKYGQIVKNGPSLIGMVIHDKGDTSYNSTLVSIIKDEYPLTPGSTARSSGWAQGDLVNVHWIESVDE